MPKYRAIPEYYDAEYEHQEMLDKDVPFLLKHLRRKQSVLELAVGTGRAAIPIAQAGHRVVGTDHHPAMLKLAQQKRDAVGLKPSQLSRMSKKSSNLKLVAKLNGIAFFLTSFF